MKSKMARILIAMTAAFMLTALGIAVPAWAVSYPTASYYISNTSCSNSNSGTSAGAPWCDFANVNGNGFAAGSSILLASGSSWTGTIAPLGDGTAAFPNTLGCYGTSCSTNYPSVAGTNSTTDVVSLVNPNYWIVENLTLTGGRHGLHANFTQLNNRGLTFRNLYIATTSQDGILLDGYNTNPQTTIPLGDWVIKDVEITNVGVTATGRDGINFIVTYPMVQMYDAGQQNAQQDILVRNSYIWNTNGAGLNGSNLTHATIMDVFIHDVNKAGVAGAGAYWTAANDVNWVNGIFTNAPWASTNDNANFVYDSYVTDMRWRGNLIRDNSASGIEVADTRCFHTCTSTQNTGISIDSNTFSNNSTGNQCTPEAGFFGDIDFWYGWHTQANVVNNLTWLRSQSCNAFIHGTANPGLTQSANTAVSSDADIYSSGYSWSSTQGTGLWTYRSSTPSSSGAYVNMPTYSGNAWSDGSGAVLSQFDLTPPSANNWIARTWTAPRAGTVTIRGWIAMNATGGDGIFAAIDSGSSWAWSSFLAGNDRTGLATNVASITVTAGQTISFGVNNGTWANGGATNTNDVVSWIPTVAYTS